jgi:putative spermidine/putrescine transport system permease protein
MPFLEWWTLLPFMVPGVALAIGYVSVFSSGTLPLVGTPYLLPFAFAVLGSPFFFRACYNALMGVDVRTLTEAASTLGSSPWRSFYKVILPNLTPGIINGSLLVFALGMGEFAVTQLTTGGNLITFPLYMDSIFMYNPQEGASMAFLSFFITWIALAVTIFIIPKITHRYRAS